VRRAPLSWTNNSQAACLEETRKLLDAGSGAADEDEVARQYAKVIELCVVAESGWRPRPWRDS
jgi:hypothetical protein